MQNSEVGTDSRKPRIGVATIGHFGHGKSTLTAALSRVSAKVYGGKPVGYWDIIKMGSGLARGDTHGVTNGLAHVAYETATKLVTHVDCPGNGCFARNAINGISQVDGAIVVVSAVDGWREQTREHLLIARHLGVDRVVAWLSNVDQLSDPALVDVAEEDTRRLLTKCGFEGDQTPVVRGSLTSAPQGDGRAEHAVLALLDALDAWLRVPTRHNEPPFLMPVENTFEQHRDRDKSTLVTGCIKRGALVDGDRVAVVGFGAPRQTRVIGIQAFRSARSTAAAGDTVGCRLDGLSAWLGSYPLLTFKKQVKRGHVLATPGSVRCYRRFQGTLRLLATADGGSRFGVATGHQLQFHAGTADGAGTICGLDGADRGMPGDSISVEVELSAPLVLQPDQPFVVRSGAENGWGSQTVGLGRVVGLSHSIDD